MLKGVYFLERESTEDGEIFLFDGFYFHDEHRPYTIGFFKKEIEEKSLIFEFVGRL